ncbi:ABC transporter permease subunit [Microlunatus panaciterrae]|uniref:Peptide/nickel transport system permease protein n=1 Tax=Microlunatus panaciterrae TaxID=400768 RepID=A0ABS2RLT4_9ACTN|nr:ABC transporter permease [Microlunatus panaciterrae]MBM7799965.1 peptide/nickel transport system permease protein [Microlunatus panaciterrae]
MTVTDPSATGRPASLSAIMGDGVSDERGTSLWQGAFERLRRNPSAILGAIIVLAFVVVAVFAPLIAPYDPANSAWIGQVTPTDVPGASPGHLLGLDPFGSDLYTQLIFGARQSLIIGVVSTALGLLGGFVIGSIAGAFGGWTDTLVMRLVDIMLSIPALLLAVSVAAVMGRRPSAIMIAIAVAQVPIFARLLRGSMLSQRGQDYVLASSSLGLRRRTIVMSHVLPNSLGPVIVQATLTLATAIIEVAALSYLGLGAPDPTVAEWGRMLVKAQDRLQSDPHLTLLPGACIAVTALGFTLLGEALREALDPKSRR